MALFDPATGQALPSEAIQRVVYITPRVHVYQIPPLASNKGYTAATWTNNPPIFTARLRIIETSIPSVASEKVSTAILLEDESSGELFAAAPYNHPSVVTQATDSSRFFAVRVVGDGGRKATLGIGFEERGEAFDFGVTLQDANKAIGLDGGTGKSALPLFKKNEKAEEPRDYSLKEGQTITVNIVGLGEGKHSGTSQASGGQAEATTPFLPPPPSAADIKSTLSNKPVYPRPSSAGRQIPTASAKDLGFDDGEFGEFQ